MSYTNSFMVILSVIILLFGVIQTIGYINEIGKIDDYKTNNMIYAENKDYMSNNIHNLTYNEAIIKEKSNQEYFSYRIELFFSDPITYSELYEFIDP